MSNPKPKHISTIGHIRLTILGGIGPKKSEPSSVTLERRHAEKDEHFYPSASFPIEELDALNLAIQAARHFLSPKQPENGDGPSAKDSSDGTEGESQEVAAASNGGQHPESSGGSSAKLPDGFTATRRPIRVPAEGVVVRRKVKSGRRAVAAKSKSRSR